MILDTLFRKFIWCRRLRSRVIDWRIRFWGEVARRAEKRQWIALVDNCFNYDLQPLFPEMPTNITKGVLKDQLRRLEISTRSGR